MGRRLFLLACVSRATSKAACERLRSCGAATGWAMLRTFGFGAQALAGAKADIGDMHANIFIPRDTHVIEAIFLDLDFTLNSHPEHMRFALVFDRLNQRVVFPSI
jgi:hypothetical protein